MSVRSAGVTFLEILRAYCFQSYQFSSKILSNANPKLYLLIRRLVDRKYEVEKVNFIYFSENRTKFLSIANPKLRLFIRRLVDREHEAEKVNFTYF